MWDLHTAVLHQGNHLSALSPYTGLICSIYARLMPQLREIVTMAALTVPLPCPPTGPGAAGASWVLIIVGLTPLCLWQSQNPGHEPVSEPISCGRSSGAGGNRAAPGKPH